MKPGEVQDLIRRAQRGEEAAMNEFLAHIRPYFERVARDFVDPARASRSVSDLVQEAEIQVWKHLEQFQGSEDEEETLVMFRSWVGRIIRRLAMNLARKRKALKRGEGRRVLPLEAAGADPAGGGNRSFDPPATDTSASARLFSRERAQEVREAIARLPDEKDRAILGSLFFDGLSLRATASGLDLPYSVVRDRYLRCVKTLEYRLGHLEARGGEGEDSRGEK